MRKDWLVRTRTGEVIGPFSQNELMEEIRKGTFTSEDEIAPPFSHWISAATLQGHEIDEFTHTSTRSQTFTRPTASGIRATSSAAQQIEEDLTPTPDFATRPTTILRSVPPPGTSSTLQAYRKRSVVVAFVLLSMLLSTVFVIRGLNPQKSTPTQATLNLPTVEESQFIQSIYGQIRAGQSQAALKILTRYHEKGPAKGDKEYVIPYAALLITERESLGRARKMLEDLIAANPNPVLKARAHHWLGYLLLSQDEGDMGEGHFLEALQLNPKEAATRFNLGRAYLKQEKFEQALEYLQLAELEAPELWLVHIYKGRARVSLGSLNEARNAFKTAIQLAPDRWVSYIYRALFLMGTSEVEAAQALLRKMLTRDPHYETSSPPPFGFFQERVNYDEYLNAFNHIMEKNNSEETEIGRLYLSYLAHGAQGGEGRQIENLAEKKGSLFAKVLGLKVLLDRDASIDELRAGVLRLPQNLGPFGYYAYALRGEARMKFGQYTDALQDFLHGLSMEPKVAAAQYGVVRVLAKEKRHQEAASELRELITLHPEYIPALTLPLPAEAQ